MKKAIVNLHTPNLSYTKYTIPTMKLYAKRFNYDFIEYKDTIDKMRPPHWSKLLAIKEHLQEYNWLLWVDADAAFTNFSSDIAKYIDPNYNMILTRDQNDLNSGIVFIKGKDKRSEDILNFAYAQTQFIGNDWQEQLGIIEAYKTIYKDNIKVLNRVKEFNNNNMALIEYKDYITHPAGQPLLREKALAPIYNAIANNNINTRNEIPLLVNKITNVKTAIEIGVQRGAYSEYIRRGFNLDMLYLIDPWKYYDEYEDIANVQQQKQEENYEFVKARFKDKVTILRDFSQNAVIQFKDNSIDFIYIDANHSYNEVKKDIEAWYPKLTENGIIAGHDYLDGNIHEDNFGVKSAVDEFAKKNNLHIITTNEPRFKSWILLNNKQLERSKI